MKRIAVIGSGISGLVAAYFLGHRHQVTVFEQNNYLGGHTNTIEVARQTGVLPVDTGFIVFNDRTYPNFIRLLDHLGVASLDTEMSFSVRCDRTGIEYCGSSLNGLFAQRRNLLRPSFFRFLFDFRRFAIDAADRLVEEDESVTVGDYFAGRSYSDAFYQRYFLPMGAAIWSCPRGTFEKFPIRFIAKFYKNHGLLGIRNRPQWKVIAGGSREYVRELCLRMTAAIRVGHVVSSVQRMEIANGSQKLRVSGRFGDEKFGEDFDHVVIAAHADQALKFLVDGPTTAEREVLGCFPYEPNVAVLHTDPSVMPRSQRAWAAWNYRISANSDENSDEKSTVTYDMNRLQRLEKDQTEGKCFFVTLNDTSAIDPKHIIREINYSHPVFSVGREAAQAKHSQLIDLEGISYCGAYWGNGFHEDGVQSALRVCQRLLDEDPWKVLSTPVGSHTVENHPLSINSATPSS